MDNKKMAFVSAAELKSFTKAAEKLGYTQSGISHLIASLESEMGFDLFKRAHGGTELTQDGRQILPYVKEAISADEAVNAAVNEIRAAQSGVLRIGTFPSMTINLLQPILHNFEKLYPKVSVSIINASHAEIETALSENRVDCAFVISSLPADFCVKKIMESPLIVLLNAKNPLCANTELTLSQLAETQLIIPDEGMQASVRRLFNRECLTPYMPINIGDDYAAIEMVRCNRGVTILPEFIMRDLPRNSLHAIPLKDAAYHIGIGYRTSRFVSPVVKRFVDSIEDVYNMEN